MDATGKIRVVHVKPRHFYNTLKMSHGFDSANDKDETTHV